MRTEQRWDAFIKEKYLQNFTPRIQRDLTILPELDLDDVEIESMFVYGPTESGKTILCAQYMMEEQKRIYLNDGPSDEYDICVFISMPDLINEIKATFESTAERTEQDVLNYYCKVHLLVLDDFGTVKPTDWVLNTIYSIINYRYEYLKKTIINSNLSLVAIAEVLGDDRITSRIERSGDIKQKQKSWD